MSLMINYETQKVWPVQGSESLSIKEEVDTTHLYVN